MNTPYLVSYAQFKLEMTQKLVWLYVKYKCPMLIKTGMYGQILGETPNIKFHENPFSRSRLFHACVLTDEVIVLAALQCCRRA